ncbi:MULTISPECIES: RHS repeat-associated core domain-containing protein [unclassified Pseudomonas]|uniref:RHS repeat-associated core domain-containing protein n=1 Tax=unclassified Pseudomonas TaxID=196821 RepID=UPI002893076D|nr:MULTISPECIES: RHS repeat-associated core domain-containing protein [unclassified Pseudomonas]
MTANLHWRTPALSVSDARGLPVRQIAYLRGTAADPPAALVSRQQHDHLGRLVDQWDPRLSAPCLSTVYSLDGSVLKSDSVDAGWRLTLPGLAGEPLQRWDQCGSCWRTTFDEQLRVIALEENSEANVEVFSYADASDNAQYNRRGQLLEQKDRSGSLSTDSFSLTGQPLNETRTFHDDQAFTSQQVFSPLGALLEQTDAGGHQRRSRFGLAGQLKQVELLISGTPDWQLVLRDAQYNANDQIIEQLAGNRVLSEWAYDPADGRLHIQSSRKDGGAVLQNLEYFYDPVGNITRIEDHAFQPRYFANQLIDGHRDFTYDSLYRLTSATGYDDAPPSDIPGLPLPSDPNNRLNYSQTYKYDSGSNLIELCHVRAGNNSTRHMRIDPHSNRGVRWTPGEPEPVFDELFDPHGNQRSVQPGQPLQWNVRDELEKVTLISRENARSDAEHYHYSQGVRVFKRHETFAANAEHFHQVRYLPGLEIRTRDNGEELHVISLGNARCLHWAKNKPDVIDVDQLRYSLEDHLGSCVMELDQQGDLTSQEGYYPFGETAWMAARHEVEVRYRFIRYSGKEMDVSGLYYYGARYYAPWLQRWVSADAEQADGLNLYAFVGNNPMRYVDPDGNTRAESVILLTSDFVSVVNNYSTELVNQLHNILHPLGLNRNMVLSFVVEGGYWYAATTHAGSLGSGFVDGIIPPPTEIAAYPTVGGVVGGNIAGDVGTKMIDPVAESGGINLGPLIPQTSKMSVSAIDNSLGIDGPVKEIKSWKDVKSELIHPALNSVINPEFLIGRVLGAAISIVPHFLNLFKKAMDNEDIKNRLDPAKIQKIENMLDEWKAAVEQRAGWAENAFDALGTDVISPAEILPNITHMTSAQRLKPITRSAMREQTNAVLGNISRAQTMVGWYKEMGTTDNQFLLKQKHTNKKKAA